MTPEQENVFLRRWLGRHLRYEAGANRRLYLPPDGFLHFKTHYGTPDEAIDSALRRAEKLLAQENELLYGNPHGPVHGPTPKGILP